MAKIFTLSEIRKLDVVIREGIERRIELKAKVKDRNIERWIQEDIETLRTANRKLERLR